MYIKARRGTFLTTRHFKCLEVYVVVAKCLSAIAEWYIDKNILMKTVTKRVLANARF